MSGLDESGRELALLREKYDEVIGVLKLRVVSAKESGMSVTEIASRTGLSRQTIYTILSES